MPDFIKFDGSRRNDWLVTEHHHPTGALKDNSPNGPIGSTNENVLRGLWQQEEYRMQ